MKVFAYTQSLDSMPQNLIEKAEEQGVVLLDHNPKRVDDHSGIYLVRAGGKSFTKGSLPTDVAVLLKTGNNFKQLFRFKDFDRAINKAFKLAEQL